MPISIDFEQQLRGPWDTASGFLIDQLELLQAQLAPIIAAASAPGLTYDEGTWTPTITGDGGGSGQAYSAQQGSYIKIGKQVTVAFNVTLTAKGTITGSVVVGGLPFPSRASFFYGALEWSGMATPFISMSVQLNPSVTFFYPLGIAAASTQGNVALTTANISNSTTFAATVTYFTP